MRFKNQQPGSSVPEVNLVPMLDVLMSVLTFFIITSMGLTGQKIGNIVVPGTEVGAGGATEEQIQEKLVIGLSLEGEILLENRTIDETELAEAMQSYLAKNPNGAIVLKADRELEYQQVENLLKKMGEIGGNSVSLSIQRN
ncbi:MAG: biopolymer transporter ExbD [Oscillatoria sp. PMC 1068.18]|nr:biopolymer transporter ExbD [Oscillatoria sp. PMC 1076.18]MEC4991460.1 biopolymer transporter ExbD [Oscillatoria sp. PMC 1068.18]